MIQRIAHFKHWQIAVLGIVTWVAAMAAVTVIAHLCYYHVFPDAWGWVAAGHIIVAGLVGWYTPKPFLEAAWLRTAREESHALARYMEDYWEKFDHQDEKIEKPPLDVFDDKEAKA